MSPITRNNFIPAITFLFDCYERFILYYFECYGEGVYVHKENLTPISLNTIKYISFIIIIIVFIIIIP